MSRAQDLFETQSYDRSREATIYNKDGFPAFERGLHEQYLQSLMTNTMGNTFYVNQRDLVKESLTLHGKMLKKDPEFMAKAAIYARNEGYMRLQPIVSLVYLSTLENKFYFKAAFDRIIRTPGDLEDFVTICGNVRNGKGLGRSVKNTISKWLNNMTQYHAIKYGASRNTGWDLGNIIKATHPKPIDKKQGELFNYVANRNADFSQLNQVNELERIKNLQRMKSEMTDAEFAAQIVDAVEKGRLPWEIVTGIVKPNTQIWEYLMKQMPYFALLRNINTLQRAGVLDKNQNVKYVADRLTNKDAIDKSMILPFRFYTALQNTGVSTVINDALREAMELSFSNVPTLKGNNQYFLDISVSMSQEYLQIGGILGIAAFMRSEQPNFMCFESRLQYADISKRDSMATNLQKVLNLGRGGTNTGLCIQHLLGSVGEVSEWSWGGGRTLSGYGQTVPKGMRNRSPVKADNIIIITDEQQNQGSLVLSEFTRYRKKVNKDAKLFIIDVSPYSSTLAPEDEPNCYFIYGWSDQVLKYLSFVTEGMGTQIDAVNKIGLTAK